MFRRKRSKRKKIIFMGIFLLVIGFTYGYFKDEVQVFNKPSTIKTPGGIEDPDIGLEPEQDAEGKNMQGESAIEDDIYLSILNDRVSDQTKIIFKTYYTKTRDTTIKESSLPFDLIGKTFGELESYLNKNYMEWTIRECSQNSVELYRTVDGLSPGHFIVREKGGYIIVFQLDESEREKLFKRTDISVEFLSDVDRKKLKTGIKVKGIDGIEQILEDYSS